MVGVEILQKNEPYLIPGYTGYCPRHPFISGKNFGDLSHELLLDPTVAHAEKLILVDNTKEQEVVRPKNADIDIVNSRSKRTDPVYTHPMLPKYSGFVPNLGELRDRPFEVHATKGIAEFERDQLKRRKSRERLKKIVDLQSGIIHPSNMEERLLLKSKFKLPLHAVRPDFISIVKKQAVDEKFEKPKDYNISPYFMDNLNPQKYFVNGYTGYIPYRKTHYAKPSKKMTTDGLCDFTSDYLHRKRVEWAPVVISQVKKGTTETSEKNQIYLKDTALMPSYTGHVPGAKYKIGKTYGYISKDANRHIEEKLFKLNLKQCKI